MTLASAKKRFAPLTEFKPANEKPVIALVSLYIYESLGIRYIGSAVRDAGFDCLEMYYENFKRNSFCYPTEKELASFISRLKENRVDIVGLSVRSSYRKLAAQLTDAIHEELGIPVIWGSTHATICPDDSLGAADAVCRGDGEVAVVQLLEALRGNGDVTKIKGVSVRRSDGSAIHNGMADYVDQEKLGDPDYAAKNKHYLKDGEWHEGDPQWNDSTFVIISSRGCPHMCTYCSNDLFLKAGPGFLRMRSAERVVGEIKKAVRVMPNVKRIKFEDDLFASNKKWTDEFVELYKKEIGLPFDAVLHPKHVSRALMAKLKDAGCSVVHMGVQSGSERMANEIYDRRIPNEKLMETFKVLNETGLRLNYDLIVDNPLETAQDKQDSFEFLLEIPRPYSLFILSLTHFPETPLTKKLLGMGLIKESDIEGNTDNSLFQWEVSLTHDRDPEDLFWLALISLLTKDFVPKGFIRFLSRRKILMRYTRPLVTFAWIANIIKLGQLAWKRLREGTLTWELVRRHAFVREIAVK